jgi:hypothetical protein
MQAHKVRVDVPEDHRITVELPEGFPAGPAEVIVLAAGGEGRRIVKAGGSLGPPQPLEQDEDPIAVVLGELREERAAKIERLSGELDRSDR